MSNRSQVVRISSSYSTLKNIEIGVPQGSILGPLLFLIYINNLPNVSEVFRDTLFADDTTLLFRDQNSDMLNNSCNFELDRFGQ